MFTHVQRTELINVIFRGGHCWLLRKTLKRIKEEISWIEATFVPLSLMGINSLVVTMPWRRRGLGHDMTGERRLSRGLKLATFEVDNFLYLFPSILPVIEFSLPVKFPISSISQLFGLFRYFANDSQSRNFVNNFRESSPTFHSPRPLFYFHPLSHWIIDNNCHSPLYQWTSPRYIHIHIPVLDAFQISAKSKWELELCQGPTTLLQHNAQLLSSNNHISLSDL